MTDVGNDQEPTTNMATDLRAPVLAQLNEVSVLRVIDMHTAGEPVRIVVEGYPALAGARLLDKRRDARDRFDVLRRRMMLEPRGHAGMYGVIPMPPCLPGADLSVLFTHAGGYSTMCGHATIAIARWAVESGQVRPRRDRAEFLLECPCGPVRAFADLENGRVVRSGFESVPAFVETADLTIQTERFGAVKTDIVYGGAYYAITPGSRLGLDFDRHDTETLVSAAAHVFAKAREEVSIARPEEPDLAFLYGVILVDDAPWPEPTRNICVFGEGQIDRSPTGSGVTARLARDVLIGDGAVDVERRFVGPTGQAFEARATRRLRQADRDSVTAAVAGQAFYSGFNTLVFEPQDPLSDGFLLSGETAGA